MDAQDRYPVARASVAPADAAWLPLGISLVSGLLAGQSRIPAIESGAITFENLQEEQL